MKSLVLILFCGAYVATAVPAAAHHSAAAFDSQKKVSVTGKVVEYRYMNPHIYLTLEVTKDDGLQYRPGMPLSNQKCDVEVARKFLND
jgi:hypothetical protein